MAHASQTLVAVTGPFVAEAAARGLRPPIRLLGQDARAWQVHATAADTLLLDEYGDLWWGRLVGRSDARIVRPLWPEESASVASVLAAALASLRAR